MHHQKICLIIFAICSSLILLSIACNRTLDIHKYNIEVDTIKEPIRFAILTDLHSSAYKDDMQELITAVTDSAPDIILFVGDIFDDNFDNQNSWTVIKALSQKYPCYYVTGNHEIAQSNIESILKKLQAFGIHVLRGTSQMIHHKDAAICISGIDDALYPEHKAQQQQLLSERLNADYYILLSHRPHHIDFYTTLSYDLVISGHAHGGQWRMPFILPNGLYAPSQGLLPRYTGGLYQFDAWKMLVSRGLDKQSVKLPRIFNRPEVVILTLT